MSYIDEIIEHNKKFVADKQYELYKTTRLPNKKIAVFSCMDTRLTELLPAALNVKNGDIKIIKNAGAVITHPFGSVMRSLLIAVYDLGVEEIMVIGHRDCGMRGLSTPMLIQKMLDRGIPQERIDMLGYYGVDINHWLKGFDNVEESVSKAVATIRNHPLMPADIQVFGFIIDPITGQIDPIQ